MCLKPPRKFPVGANWLSRCAFPPCDFVPLVPCIMFLKRSFILLYGRESQRPAPSTRTHSYGTLPAALMTKLASRGVKGPAVKPPNRTNLFQAMFCRKPLLFTPMSYVGSIPRWPCCSHTLLQVLYSNQNGCSSTVYTLPHLLGLENVRSQQIEQLEQAK